MSRKEELARRLASYKGHLYGRIGPLERLVCHKLMSAKHDRTDPVTTGHLVREVYLSQYGRKSRWRDKDAPPPKLAHWMYGRIRKACAVYAVRVGRLEARGFPVLWRLKDDVSTWSIRRQKTARDAKRRRRRARKPRLAHRPTSIAVHSLMPPELMRRLYKRPLRHALRRLATQRSAAAWRQRPATELSTDG